MWREDLFNLIDRTRNLDWLILTKRPENILKMISYEWLQDLPNVWMGTTAEDQDNLDERIEHLLNIPCSRRFLSLEPLLGPIYLGDALMNFGYDPTLNEFFKKPSGDIDWVIVGGESGPDARPMDLDWARMVRDQCQEARVPFFFKQVGGWPNKRHLLSEIPEDLRIREFPK
jgi:protein gp37